MNTMKNNSGRKAMAMLAAVLAMLLVSGCKSEARVNCEKNAEAIGADKSPCKNL